MPQLELQGVDPDLGQQGLRVVGVRGDGALGQLGVRAGSILLRAGAGHEQRHNEPEERELRQAWQQPEEADDDGCRPKGVPPGEELAGGLGPERAVVADARDQQARGDRDQQRWDLRDEAVTDRQQRVGRDGLAEGQVVGAHPDGEAADEIDGHDEDGRDGIALHELGGTVHRTVEVRLLGDAFAQGAGLLLVDEAGGDVGVDGHLPAGHGVEGEAGGDLRHPARPVGDDDELDHDEDEEDHEPDHDGASDDEVAERLDDLAGIAVEQDEPGGRDVEAEAHEGRDQQQGREDRQLHVVLEQDRREQDHHRERDVGGEHEVQHHGGHGDDHHHHGRHHEGRHGVAPQVVPHAEPRRRRR